MALRTGSPQSELAQKFTTEELADLFAARKIEFEAKSKEDVRFQLMTYHIVRAVLGAAGGAKAVRRIKPEDFALKWGAEKPGRDQTQDQIRSAFEVAAAIWRTKGRDDRKQHTFTGG